MGLNSSQGRPKRPFLFASQQSVLQLGHEGKSLFFAHARSLVSGETYPPAVFIAVGGTDRAALAGGQAAAHAGQEPVQGIPVPPVPAPADPVCQIRDQPAQPGLQKMILPEDAVLGPDAGPVMRPCREGPHRESTADAPVADHAAAHQHTHAILRLWSAAADIAHDAVLQHQLRAWVRLRVIAVAPQDALAHPGHAGLAHHGPGPVHPGEALVEPLQRPAAQIHHTAADEHRPIAAIDGDAVTPGTYGRRDVLVLDDAAGAAGPVIACHPEHLPLHA